MNQEVVLKVDRLSKKFGSYQALKNITFDIKKGEVFGFIGPNGAGKTTTIRSILGIIKASSGSVEVFNKSAWANRVEIHKRIAYVPGDSNLWPNLTGGEIIDLLLKMNDGNHSSLTDELINKFSLDVSKKFKTYSKGNKQKVSLVAAFSTEADLFIFDEPTSGLDPLNEEIFQQEVRNLKSKGKSILLSSHILSEVEEMSDRIGIIREGEIIEIGTLDQLQHLTRMLFKVKSESDLSDIKNLDSVHDLKLDDNNLKAVFSVDVNAVGEIVEILSSKSVVQLQSTPPTLEDLFLNYYKTPGKENVSG